MAPPTQLACMPRPRYPHPHVITHAGSHVALPALLPPHLLVFQMCTVSWSAMPCCWACSSSRSKKYFTASGTERPVLRVTWNKSSTNFCRVPCGGAHRCCQWGQLAARTLCTGPAGPTRPTRQAGPPSWTAGGSGRSQGWPWPAHAHRRVGCPSEAGPPAPRLASPGATAGCPLHPHPPASGCLCRDPVPLIRYHLPGSPGPQLQVGHLVEGFCGWKHSGHEPTPRSKDLPLLLETGTHSLWGHSPGFPGGHAW